MENTKCMEQSYFVAPLFVNRTLDPERNKSYYDKIKKVLGEGNPNKAAGKTSHKIKKKLAFKITHRIKSPSKKKINKFYEIESLKYRKL